MAYIEITKTNSYGEQGKALIRTSDIIAIKELHVPSKKLYDEEGNVVSEEKGAKEFLVLVPYSEQYHIDENEYNRLVALLTTETK